MSSNKKENTAQDLIAFEKQLSQFDKDTLTTYIASLAVDWTEDQQEAFIKALCMIEEMILPKKTETGALDSSLKQPASSTDELTKTHQS